MSLLDELKETPEESREYTDSEQWRPEPGDEIEGVVIDRYTFDTEFSEGVPGVVLQVDGDDTPWSVAGLHSVLRDIINEQDPQKGDRVAYIYSGKRQGQKNAYHHYRGAIRRGGGGQPVPAQRNGNGSAKGGSNSTQHEDVPAAKTTPRRKPGQKVAVAADDEPPY